MKIQIQYDASAATAPAGFSTAVNAAVAQLEILITDDVTVSINVGWGEVGGQALPAGALGASLALGRTFSYSTLTAALQSHVFSADDAAAVATLPGSDPSQGAGFFVKVPQQLALGLTSQGSGALFAGYVGLNSTSTYSFDPSHGAVAGAYDAVGILLHEISEVLGRSSRVDIGAGTLSVLDLFRYASAGVHTTADAGGWFSVDGTHLLLPFNDPNTGGDAGDWAISVGGDAFTEALTTGRKELLSMVDLRALDLIGYHLGSSALDGAALPVVYELDGTTAGDNLTGSTSADFIRGLDSNDTIDGGAGSDDVNGNKGDDIVHGGDGNDFVRGGQGNDTVYGDVGDDPHVNGNLGDDLVRGGAGNDTLYGGQGQDTLYGDDGNDLLSGDIGVDALFGGAGADRFVIARGGGFDWVGDFNPAEGDRIQLAPGTTYTVTSFQGQVVIDLGGGDELGLAGVAAGSFNASWLVFG
ncbi:MAG TPA: NF038122 family metalloprotease [Caulobacteraceae bacterium]|nr:NF038122 family metalloprotease [Caulobacteraceae bacterium]